MATTTNYGWTTPDDTALVKDGASAIRTLGTSIDTTTKNLNPSTTLGDIEYRSSTANTNTRLGIGTANQVLRVNSGATAPEWATLSADSMTVLASGSLSGTNVSLTGISQAYKNLLLYVSKPTTTTAFQDLIFRVNTNTGGIYDFLRGDATSATWVSNVNQTKFDTSNNNAVTTTNRDAFFSLEIADYATTTFKQVTYTATQYTGVKSILWNFGSYNSTTAVTSVQISTLSGTGSYNGGTYILYGVK
jgi:hypothetical protein